MLNAGMAAASWNFDMKLAPTQNKEEDEEDYLTLADLKDGITKLQMLRDARINSRREEEEEKQGGGYVPGSNTLWFRIPSSNNATDLRDLIYSMMNRLPKKLTDLINVDYASTNRFADVMRMFAEAHITSTESLYWILHRYYSPFLGHQDWPTWVPNLAQKFSSAHWEWPFTPSFAMARDTRKHLLVCRGMKADMIHMATKNITMDTFDKKKSIAQRLAASMTLENVAQVYPILEDNQRSITKQGALIIPDE
jgi:hypothetical protein